MHDLLSGLLGVPATILIAAGAGLGGVTAVSRVRRRRDPPMRWAHGALGLGLLLAGSLLMLIDVSLVGVR